jgi:iron complex outermembrane receptor protein
MNNFVSQRREGKVEHHARLRINPVAAACATLLFTSTAAFAQQATLNVVTITGLRGSIESSIAVKKNSDSIVEVVTAEDIGKLPDVSIAESLARLPGLAGQRVEGRTQGISIRGMAPAFGLTLLNGRELASTAGGRSVEFDQFPSELINSATVYKTPDAALGSQGLSGTVNMQTVRPLDMRGRQVSVNVRGESNSNGAQIAGSSANGARLSASYIDQFADNTIGVALGFAHLDAPGQQQHQNSWWWGNSAIWGGGFRGLENADAKKAPSTLQGFDASVRSNASVRDGLMGVLEFRPNKDVRSTVDLYYSKFTQDFQGREFQVNLAPDWSGNGTPGSLVKGGPIFSDYKTIDMVGGSVMQSGTVSNVDPLMLTRYGKREDKISALGWKNEIKLGDWKTEADLSYSKATRDEFKGEITASPTALSGFTNFYNEVGKGASRYPTTLNWATPGAIQLRGYGAWGNVNGSPKVGTGSPISVSDEMQSLRLSAKRDLDWGPVSNFEGGVNYTDRKKDNSSSTTVYALKNGAACFGKDTCAPIPAGWIQTPANVGFAGNPGLVSFDMRDFLASDIYNQGVEGADQAPGRIWGVQEKVTTLFGKLGLDFTAGVPIRGNFGVQVVQAKQTANGLAWDNVKKTGVQRTGGKDYTDILPSLNLAADVAANTMVRFGAAQVAARPDMEAMRAGMGSVSIATTGAKAGMPSASGGNPELEPWRATALDLSVEKYFGKRSYVAAAVFQKRLHSTIYSQTDYAYNFAGLPNLGAATTSIGEYSRPANGTGGMIQGTEFSVALDGALLSPMLDGFGIIGSLSNTRSDVPGQKNKNGTRDLTKPMEGLSGQVRSLTAYYEKNGFQARIAQRYRSQFVSEVRATWIDTSLATIEEETLTDLQFGYSFETGAFKGLSILLQVNNLNDTPYRTMLNDDSVDPIKRLMPEKYHTYGRQTLLGVTYKF